MGKSKSKTVRVDGSLRPPPRKSVHVRCSDGMLAELERLAAFGSPAAVLKRAFAEAKTARTALFQDHLR